MKLLILAVLLKLAAAGNNVCRTEFSYNFKYISRNCYHNPNLFSNSKDIILRMGLPVEIHTVQTKDGYYLTLFRIPHNSDSDKVGSPVYLQHGAFGSSDNFLATANRSLAYQLSLAGYDVWLANTRGNFYSNRHQTISRKNRRFWNYTLDDIANFDLPAVIDHIKLVNNRSGKVDYIGHSQGTTTALIYAISNSEHARRNLRNLILLAPIAYLTNLPIFGAGLVYTIINIIYTIGITHIGSHLVIVTTICTLNSLTLLICTGVVNYACGRTNKYLPEEIPLAISYIFNRESFHPIQQYIQIARTKEFKPFDYGSRRNQMIYGSSRPPLYDLARIPLPVYLFSGETDNFAPVPNVDRLENELQNRNEITERIYFGNRSTFNHINFLFSRDIVSKVYQPILNILLTGQPTLVRVL